MTTEVAKGASVFNSYKVGSTPAHSNTDESHAKESGIDSFVKGGPSNQKSPYPSPSVGKLFDKLPNLLPLGRSLASKVSESLAPISHSFQAGLGLLGEGLNDAAVDDKSSLKHRESFFDERPMIRLRAAPDVIPVLLENQLNLSNLDPSKEIAVFIEAKSDHNQYLNNLVDKGYYRPQLIDDYVRSEKYNVLYFEAGNDQDVESALKQVNLISGRKIGTLVLAGHGTRGSLQLGDKAYEFNDAGNPVKIIKPEDHSNVVDYQDSSLFKVLDQVMEPDGGILLHACSTGAGGDNKTNLVNEISWSVPGRWIVGFKDTISRVRAEFKPDSNQAYLFVFDTSGKVRENLYYLKINPPNHEEPSIPSP